MQSAIGMGTAHHMKPSSRKLREQRGGRGCRSIARTLASINHNPPQPHRRAVAFELNVDDAWYPQAKLRREGRVAACRDRGAIERSDDVAISKTKARSLALGSNAKKTQADDTSFSLNRNDAWRPVGSRRREHVNHGRAGRAIGRAVSGMGLRQRRQRADPQPDEQQGDA